MHLAIEMENDEMKIITISRQFGSGGRELGKRLSDVLKYDYYDREIITKLSEEQGLDEEYVSRVLNNHEWNTVPITFNASFVNTGFFANSNVSLMSRQREIIEDIAKAGNDCIIVGRNADVILREYHPLRIAVCADMDYRVARCFRHEQKKTDGGLTEKEVINNIRRIDKERARTRELISGKDRGDPSSFDLVVNSAGWEIKELVNSVADFAEKWFNRKEV